MFNRQGFGRCWLHRWTKWGAVQMMQVKLYWAHDTSFEYYQQRNCEKCNKIQRREVNY